MAVDDELWDEFHRVVNMTSRELDDWLRTRFAGTDGEELPDQAGTRPASTCSTSSASGALIWLTTTCA